MSDLPKIDISKRKEARQKVVDDFVHAHYGRSWDKEEETELYADPFYQFSTGILFPQKVNDSLNFEVNFDLDDREILSDEESDLVHNKSKSTSEEDEIESEELNTIDLASQNRPSAFGINFISEKNQEFKIEYGYSTYEKETNPDPKATRRSYDGYLYKRSRINSELIIKPTATFSLEKKLESENLKLSVKTREKDNHLLTSVSMVNILESEEGESLTFRECFFQCGLKIKSLKESKFLPIGSGIKHQSGENGSSLELLFRKKKSFATGQGCAANWEEQDPCKEIWTEFIPQYELSKISPSDDIAECKMNELADIDNSKSISDRYKPLDNLIKGYENWLLRKTEEKVSDEHLSAAERHLEQAKDTLERMKEGLNILKNENNPKVDLAFRLTNHAMAIQFNRLNFLKSKEKDDDLNCEKAEIIQALTENNHSQLDATWRPFQIAFLLLVIPEISKPDQYTEYRNRVDLIWFPTGGGKTEAYFGVFAFTAFLRRLKDPTFGGAGVCSIMRYTLRLLTSDQFRRSSALICAMEFLRLNKPGRLSYNLGEEEINLGLWLGRAGSPKTHKSALDEMASNQGGKYSFNLHECPWCKSSLIKLTDEAYKEIDGEVIIKCSDHRCYFANQLPIRLWEEAIYKEKPTLVLGTVDNFAKLVWKDDAIKTFQNDDHKEPDLIIQDELHLISGPLGTMTALYENILMKLLSRNTADSEISPKIIGASATLTFSDEQTKALYRGRKKSIFPPQVLDWGDSYFSKEVPNEGNDFGRLYLGYFGSSRGSMIDASAGAVVPLLQSSQSKLPQIMTDANSGETEIEVDILSSLKEFPSFSVYHGNDFTKYTIEKIEEENDKIILRLDKALSDSLNGPSEDINIRRSALYPSVSSKDTAFDPYGTLIWYFNSRRELGFMSNQIINLISKLKTDAVRINLFNLGSYDNPRGFTRKIRSVEELTGRLSQSEIENIKARLNIPWKQNLSSKDDPRGIDILLATNMISVGVDIPRLGLMVINGHPRSTAEYIQASSRIGRLHPGLVVTLYNHSKSKDRSIYEQFKNYHQSFYKYVEEVSVTPFAAGARKRGLPAIFVGLVRSLGQHSPSIERNDPKILEAKEWILEAVRDIDQNEENSTEKDIDKIIDLWTEGNLEEWGDMVSSNRRRRGTGKRLLDPDGDLIPEAVFSAPTSLRSSGLSVEVKLSGVDE